MVAEHVSLPLREDVRITLKVSQNLHASMTPRVLKAVVAPGDTGRTGFDLEHDFLQRAGLDLTGAQQADGAGGDAHFSPSFMVSVTGMRASAPDCVRWRSNITLTPCFVPAHKAGSWLRLLQGSCTKPPVSHPIFLTHPITGKKVLYANPGYAIRINELPERESDDILAFLFEHQLQPRFRYVHRWTEDDLLFWDDIATLHNSHADYGPDEHRLIKRCQVMADRIFDPSFVRAALGEPIEA
jgi:hypothetical protein